MQLKKNQTKLRHELGTTSATACLVCLEEFKSHIEKKHEHKLLKKVALLQKLQSLRETVSKQKENLVSSIF